MQLKKLCAICSAVLVAFSCSLVPAVISPAYALSTVDDYMFTVYASPVTFDPAWSSKAIDIPCSSGTFYTWSTAQPSAYGYIKVSSGLIEPVYRERTLIIDLGYDNSYSVGGNHSVTKSTLYYYSGGNVVHSLNDGVRMLYKAPNLAHGTHYVYSVTLPSGTTGFYFNTPCTYLPNGYTGAQNNLLVTNGAYVIDTGDPDVVDIVAQILQQLQSVNAELDTQTTIMRSINSYLSNVDSNVTSIYELLHEALAQESSEIDSKSQAVADTIMQQDNAEQFWNDKNQENFDALDLDNFSFSFGVVSALGTVGNLFTSIWNSLGDTVVIFTFPLMLGITLVAIGRVSRHGGKGKSGKGGDSE